MSPPSRPLWRRIVDHRFFGWTGWALAILLLIGSAGVTATSSSDVEGAQEQARVAEIQAQAARDQAERAEGAKEVAESNLSDSQARVRELEQERSKLLGEMSRLRARAEGRGGGSEPEPEPEEPPSPTNVVASFSGSGIQSTRPFRVDGPWTIRWKASGDIFQLFLNTATGELVDIAANDTCPCNGRSFQPQGGRYFLEVNAIGSWEIEIIQR